MTTTRKNSGRVSTTRPVSGLLESLPIADKLSRSLAITNQVAPIWEKNIDRSLREHTQLAHFEDGVLVITADSPLWANLLHHQQQSVLDKLQAAGLNMIRHIYIRTAPRQLPPQPRKPRPLPKQDKSVTHSLEVAANSIDDPEVKQALIRLASTLTDRDQSNQD